MKTKTSKLILAGAISFLGLLSTSCVGWVGPGPGPGPLLPPTPGPTIYRVRPIPPNRPIRPFVMGPSRPFNAGLGRPMPGPGGGGPGLPGGPGPVLPGGPGGPGPR